MSDASLAAFFVVGLFGGAHCIGMCGPLVTMYADRMGGDRKRLRWYDVRQHLLFNLGRTASYAVVGALFGALGLVFFDAAAVTPLADVVRSVTGIVVGLFVVGTGLVYVFRGTVPDHRVPGLDGAFGRVYGALTARVDGWVEGPGIAGLGAVHGLLPCPILYPAFLYAFGTGAPTEGALSLAALGLGTLPAVFLYGTVVGAVNTADRVRLHRALGVAFVVLGVIPLSNGLAVFGIHVPHVPLPMPMPTY
ncbi:sulfite exporter TauE/SafE family protein [Haloarchaeobius sp. HRN-SO-5]|uniref:sulfite exporter TauE/SafE family protein n=1 Tax=Haloarchaeobius sp. HRN-SO-5 TaxID=3446118 RepID=UPI003EB918AB